MRRYQARKVRRALKDTGFIYLRHGSKASHEIDRGPNGIARSPDIPGCFGRGSTRDEARENIAEALEGCIEFIRDEGQLVPESHDYELTTVAVRILDAATA